MLFETSVDPKNAYLFCNFYDLSDSHHCCICTMIVETVLLQLELNLRRVALSVEWSKPVDDAHAIVSASIVTSPVRGSSSYVGSRKLGKKNNSGDEFSFMSRRATNTISDIYWWRGGRLLRQLFQCKMLPRALASKGSRQGMKFPTS